MIRGVRLTGDPIIRGFTAQRTHQLKPFLSCQNTGEFMWVTWRAWCTSVSSLRGRIWKCSYWTWYVAMIRAIIGNWCESRSQEGGNGSFANVCVKILHFNGFFYGVVSISRGKQKFMLKKLVKVKQRKYTSFLCLFIYHIFLTFSQRVGETTTWMKSYPVSIYANFNYWIITKSLDKVKREVETLEYDSGETTSGPTLTVEL